MIIRVLAPALPHLYLALRRAGPAWPVVGVQERRVARATARGRSAAPHQSPAPAGVGRPRNPRRADPASAGKAGGAPSDHPRHCPALAPPPDHPMPLLELLKYCWMQSDIPDRCFPGGSELLAFGTVGIFRVLSFQQPVGDARTPGAAVELAAYLGCQRVHEVGHLRGCG